MLWSFVQPPTNEVTEWNETPQRCAARGRLLAFVSFPSLAHNVNISKRIVVTVFVHNQLFFREVIYRMQTTSPLPSTSVQEMLPQAETLQNSHCFSREINLRGERIYKQNPQPQRRWCWPPAHLLSPIPASYIQKDLKIFFKAGQESA